MTCPDCDDGANFVPDPATQDSPLKGAQFTCTTCHRTYRYQMWQRFLVLPPAEVLEDDPLTHFAREMGADKWEYEPR